MSMGVSQPGQRLVPMQGRLEAMLPRAPVTLQELDIAAQLPLSGSLASVLPSTGLQPYHLRVEPLGSPPVTVTELTFTMKDTCAAADYVIPLSVLPLTHNEVLQKSWPCSVETTRLTK
jgi:hypothetical protein